MKFDVPEAVAAAAIKALREGGGASSFDPNVVALARAVTNSLNRPAPARLTADELEGVLWAAIHMVEEYAELTKGEDPGRILANPAMRRLQLLEMAIPKLETLRDRERAREAQQPV